MDLDFNLDEKPPKIENLLFGIQWLAVSIPIILIIGKIVGSVYTNGNTVSYIQTLLILMGIALLLQVKFGHKLPMVIGPATVLLIAILATLNQGFGSINSSIIISGAILTIIAATGLLKYIKKLFTPRVIIVILLLIAFTLAPTILKLMIETNGVVKFTNLLFSLGLILIILFTHKRLKGLWRSTLPLWIMLFGSLLFYLIFNQGYSQDLNLQFLSLPSINNPILAIPDIGMIFAFIICFLALTINDLGSIQSVGYLLKLNDMDKRIKKGIVVTGLTNILAGILGLVGPVNYSMTPGIIATTKCASRYPLVITAIGMIIIAFSPLTVSIISSIPSPVIAAVLIYIMTAQIGAGINIGIETKAYNNMDHGIVMGLPIIIATLIVFLPQTLIDQLPLMIRPILTNGFVMGVLTVFILEHLIFKEPKLDAES
ncbi:uracil permease [Methanobrevibacter olleyae]|uniref:Uracil permease n=1 Tax=Methanobrevibacter olleyae TaxID=294671 RepID=A0A1I4G361_METOL|nr:purine/pyrimidine permease [Methanobrevibacter olleyae]SFL23930.1 uracil permease [Methanobrevibacter olleyae]